jgi:hypothetical protein
MPNDRMFPRTVLTSSSCPNVCTHEGASCRLSLRRVALRTGSRPKFGPFVNVLDEILFPLAAEPEPPPTGFDVAVDVVVDAAEKKLDDAAAS